MTFRKAVIILKKHGFDKIIPTKSDHVKFCNSNGYHICLPRKNEINKMLWKRLEKENNL